jgi:hypothetical protein
MQTVDFDKLEELMERDLLQINENLRVRISPALGEISIFLEGREDKPLFKGIPVYKGDDIYADVRKCYFRLMMYRFVINPLKNAGWKQVVGRRSDIARLEHDEDPALLVPIDPLSKSFHADLDICFERIGKGWLTEQAVEVAIGKGK